MGAARMVVHGIGVIAHCGAVIRRACVLRLARVLCGVFMHAGIVLLALKNEPRHRGSLDREPGEQHEQDTSAHRGFNCVSTDSRRRAA